MYADERVVARHWSLAHHRTELAVPGWVSAAMQCAVGAVTSRSTKALTGLHYVPGLADVLAEGRAS